MIMNPESPRLATLRTPVSEMVPTQAVDEPTTSAVVLK